MSTVTIASQPSVRSQVSPEEWQTRVDLAACYRLVAHFGWDDLIFTHISARVSEQENNFLINPYGMMFEEITASSLVKIDLAGRVVMDTPYPVNPAGFMVHSSVHEVRPDAQCVIHLHTLAGVAVSAQEHGLLPISQQSMFPLSSLAYHDYEGIVLNAPEKPRLQADLGDKQFLILKNHGLLTVGETIPDAFLYMFFMQRACEIQIMAQSGGGPLVHVPQPIVDGIRAQADVALKQSGGRLAWPGLLRKLDRIDPSYRQ